MRDCKRILDGIELVTRELTKHQCPVARKNVETLAQHGIEILGRVVAGIASHDAANPSNSRATTSSKPMEKAKPYDTAWVDEVVSTKPIIDPTIADDAVRKPYDDAWIDEVVNDPQMKFEQFTPSETHEWTERAVPSSPMARIFGFGSLAAKVMLGTAAEAARNIGNPTRSSIASDANTEKLVETLCTMRGAALKLGQMLSIQDEAVVPPALAVALERVRQGAHIMPKKQLYKQMQQELGLDWREKVGEFDDTPIAAASIGQVHRGSLLDGQLVAMKVQYPGVAESIESDLLNLKRLITYTNFLPKGLYMDSILKSAQTELVLECDYLNEQENQMKFRHLVAQDSYMNARFVVPRVHPEMSTSRILTSDLMAGVAIDKILHLPQKIRNRIALRILVLTIKELFAWRFMQTDPNWSNFLYNAATDQIALIDLELRGRTIKNLWTIISVLSGRLRITIQIR